MRQLIRSAQEFAPRHGRLALDTLRLLVRYLERESTARISLSYDRIGGTPLIQLLAYQVARESAIRNALRHARASEILVHVVDGWDTSESRGRRWDRFRPPTPLINRSTSDWRLCVSESRLRAESSYVDSRLGEGTRIVARLSLPTTRSRRAGPRRRPARFSRDRSSAGCVLETEMCATSERKRRQRANRNGEPLDQLHGTSLPASSELSHCPYMWFPRLPDPLFGGPISLSASPL